MLEQSGETEHLLASLVLHTEHFFLESDWNIKKYSLLQFLYRFLGRQIFKCNNKLGAFASLTAIVFLRDVDNI